jgi:CRP/FNR family cyclic AMP-dependent transcriptional regulator
MANRSKREILAESPLFANLFPIELSLLADLVNEREYRTGDEIFQQGQPGDAVFVIVEGEVEIMGQPPQGMARPLAVLKAPEFFGEMSLIDKQYRSATARAKTDVRLLQLTNDNLHIFAKNYRNGFTWIVVNIARALSARLREMNRSLMERV